MTCLVFKGFFFLDQPFTHLLCTSWNPGAPRPFRVLIDSAFIGFLPGKLKQRSLAVVTTGKSAMVTERVQIRAPWLLRGNGEGCHGY